MKVSTFFISSLIALSSGAVAVGQSSSPASPAAVPAQQPPPMKANPGPPASAKHPVTTTFDSPKGSTERPAAKASNLPPAVPAGRPVIGLALEGGGALGLAHIGVLKWMEENRIPIDRVSGTSMGALIGALYASGKSVDEVERIGTSSAFESMFYIRTPYNELGYRRREDERDFPQTLNLGLKGGPSFRNALISDDGLNDFLAATFSRYNNVGLSFDSFPIPFRCVATDLNTTEPVIFDSGSLPFAVRSSISIPGVFPPVQYRGHYLVDGAFMENLPTEVVRRDLHSDVVIGIQLRGTEFQERDVNSLLGVFALAVSAAVAKNERESRQFADTVVEVDTSKFTTTDYDKARVLIKLGYDAVAANAVELKQYALSEADWRQYLADRSARIRPEPGLLQAIRVEGSTPAAQADAEKDFRNQKNKPMDPTAIAESLHRVKGNGTNQAFYETFQPNQASASPVDAIKAFGPDTGLSVRLSPSRSGPPFLQFGIDGTAMNSNVSRTTLDFRLLNTDLGGFGSELRTDVRVGFLTQVSTEYYRLLSHSGYFLQPQVGYVRQPVYLWADQKRISEHLGQQAGGGFEAGRTFSRNLQASFSYQNQVVRWHPVTGDDGTVPVSGDAQTATFHLAFDNTQSGVFAVNRGLHDVRIDLRAGALFHTTQSENAPFLQASVRKPFHFGRNQLLLLSADANSYAKRNVTEPLRFTVGGPQRLSASSIDEFRGTDNYLMRAGFARKLSALPAGYGQGLYGAFAYEAAEVWSPEKPAFLRQDGVVTIIGILPVGAVTLGGSVGDASHRKIFITFGRLF